MQRLVLIGVALFLVPSAALAAGAGEENYAEKIKDLQSEILGILLLNELKLDKPAGGELLAFAYHARQITGAYEERTAVLSKHFEKACREFREEDFANKGFSKRVEKRAEGLEHKLQAERKRFCDSVNGLEEKAAGLLTPVQARIVSRFPGRFEGRILGRLLGGKPLLKPLPKPLRSEFSVIRLLSGPDWGRWKETVLEDWVRRYERMNRPFRDLAGRGEYKKRLEALIEDVRRMSEKEFAASGEEILDGLRSPDKIGKIAGDLKEIARDHYGGIGRIGRFLCERCAIPLLEKRLGLKPGEGKGEPRPAPDPGPSAPAENECTGDPAVIQQLRVEINVLNLINGLHLTVEQMEALLHGARKHRELQERYLGKGSVREQGTLSYRETYEAFLDLKMALESGEKPGKELQTRFMERFKGIRELRRRAFRPDRAAYSKELKALERETESELLDSQKDVIAGYDPCLIPPKNLKDPVRVGQASDGSGFGRILERARKIPEGQWERLGEAILGKIMERWEDYHGRYTEEERNRQIADAKAVLEEARELPEVDFKMRKDELAGKLAFRSRKHALKDEMAEAFRVRGLPGKIASILLDPRVISVFERRLEQMKGFQPDKPVDLEGIKGADAKKGKCGKKYED